MCSNDSLYQYMIVRGTKNWTIPKLHCNTLWHITMNLKCICTMAMDPLSYGGVVCCCIGLHLQKEYTSGIDQIITFGMPKFSKTKQMKYIAQTFLSLKSSNVAKLMWTQCVWFMAALVFGCLCAVAVVLIFLMISIQQQMWIVNSRES